VKAGLSGVGTLTIVVPTAVPPSVVSQSVTAPSGTAFSVPIKLSWQGNYQALGWGLSNPQPGMTISGSNVFSWPKPVVGNYSVKITLTDWNTGLVGTGVLTLSIVAPGPTITAVALTGVAAKPLTGSITVSDPTANSVTATISGVPAGMSISTTGATIAISWKSPVTGTYQLAITAVDANGNKASATVPVTITAH
jgi:hypothetical protein